MKRNLRRLFVGGSLAVGALGLGADTALAQAPARTYVPVAPGRVYYGGYYYYPQYRTGYVAAPSVGVTTAPRYPGNYNRTYPDWSTARPVPMAKPWMRPFSR